MESEPRVATGWGRILFLPFEVQARELHGRFLLAAEALSRGYFVVLGDKTTLARLVLDWGAPGIFLWKAVPRPGVDLLFSKLKEMGMKQIAQDEEAGIVSSRFEDFFSDRASLRSLGKLDGFLCWGPDDYDFLESLNGDDGQGLPAKVLLTGSPRASLWGDFGNKYFEAQIEAFREQLGDYIVFSTNFASQNEVLSGRRFTRFSQRVSSLFSEVDHNKQVQIDSINSALFADAIRFVATHTQLTVVIRPHPSENPAFWQKKFKGHSGIQVIANGDTLPLNLGAVGVVQNSSTIALELFGGGPRLFALVKEETTGHSGANVPNLVSELVFSGADIVAALAGPKRTSTFTQGQQMLVERKVVGRGNTQNLSNIMDFIDTLDVEPFSGQLSPSIGVRMRAVGVAFARVASWPVPTFLLPTKIVVGRRKRSFISKKYVEFFLSRALYLMGKNEFFRVTSVGGAAFVLHPLMPRDSGQ